MSAQALKARSSWLFSFGDVITLLITFFIMMIVLNKGEITRIQKWTEEQLDLAYLSIEQQMAEVPSIEVSRKTHGIVILIDQSDAYVRGGFEPSETLAASLIRLSEVLGRLPLFALDLDTMPDYVVRYAEADDLKWRAEISVEGHSDDDRIDPNSVLRNNWFLSTMRAQTVMRLLFENSGLSPQLFGVAGYGQFRPLASNATPEGKAMNRRVQILISASFEKDDWQE
ncbi:MAG: OmpA/MotB family protein [Hydrogenovibrio sp.]